MIVLYSVIMMSVLSRGDAVRDNPGSIPNHNWTTEPEFMKAKSRNWVNEGNPCNSPTPTSTFGRRCESRVYGSRGGLGRRDTNKKPWGAKGGAK
jgi:hypothetical protein